MSEVPAGPSPDYGIDAPGIRRGMALVGVGGVILCTVATLLSARLVGTAATLSGWSAVGAALVAIYGFGMAGYMTYGSRIGKRRDRERLLDLSGVVSP